MATLGEQAVGSTVLLNIDGIAREHVVIHHGNPNPSVYENSCDGTWLLLNVAFDVHVLNGSTMPSYDYANSKLHNYLNTTYINRLDRGVRKAVKQIKIPYTLAGVTDGSVETLHNGLPARVFLLSCAEAGYTGGDQNVEGAVLQWFSYGNLSTKWTFYTTDGVQKNTVSRTPSSSDPKYMCTLTNYGTVVGAYVTAGYYIRPVLVLPYETIVNADGLIEVPVSKAITGNVTIGGVQRELTGEGYVNINGVLRPLAYSQVNLDGVLRYLCPIYTWKKYNVNTVTTYTPYIDTATTSFSIRNGTKITLYSNYSCDSNTGNITVSGPYITSDADDIYGDQEYKRYKYMTSNSSVVVIKSARESSSTIDFTCNTIKSRANEAQEKGDFIENVTASNETAYPENGIHTDGYWYIKQ